MASGSDTIMKSYGFFVSKGGAAKTTLAVHFAWYLRRAARRVLFADLDPQANAANILTRYGGKDATYKPNTIDDVGEIADGVGLVGGVLAPVAGQDIGRVCLRVEVGEQDAARGAPQIPCEMDGERRLGRAALADEESIALHDRVRSRSHR